MKKWHLIIDVEKCVDCNNCFMSCKDEHVDNDWPGYTRPQPRHGHRWINIMRAERGQYPLVDVSYRPTPCMHCEDAPCIHASKGSITKRADGIVMIDPVKAKGQQELINACPYQAIWWNQEQDVPQKCTLCAHLLDQGWKQPRCVQACPTSALRAVCADDTEMSRIYTAEKLEVLKPEANTQPSVFYKNLYRFNKCFIGGSIAANQKGIVDCIEGAKVTLLQGKDKLTETLTDNFGDFKFDQLAENSGKYVIQVQMPGFPAAEVTLELTSSKNIGTIYLS
ncbi:Pyrogallol hydroxytransferase small subunit [Sporomusa silvacetica DSM 10669]|uniref:Pyrogallol hydroxytransferase small subunit n=1 Tax=Sporomusa silvacetica DSM 10669 TaxID=1123289 RepID=A0ABZ3IGH2_9FIRM|nr:4Fe-4S dicluster domain-containing protein [Sporomusa silvacetica]OZC17064.1 pyrogallol hydroxytransferase small subunit [Sporomusa silvacetica DSM 10669]